MRDEEEQRGSLPDLAAAETEVGALSCGRRSCSSLAEIWQQRENNNPAGSNTNDESLGTYLILISDTVSDTVSGTLYVLTYWTLLTTQ